MGSIHLHGQKFEVLALLSLKREGEEVVNDMSLLKFKQQILTDERNTFYTIVIAVVEKKRDQSKIPDRCRTLHEFGKDVMWIYLVKIQTTIIMSLNTTLIVIDKHWHKQHTWVRHGMPPHDERPSFYIAQRARTSR